MRISIKHNIRQARKRLTKVQRKQLPFAISLALNNTAHIVRKYVIATVYPNAFPQARNKTFPRVAFKVQRSTKRKLTSEVYDRLGRAHLAKHIDGRLKRARDGTSLAVPINAKKTSTGRHTKRTSTSNPAMFNADVKGRGPALWLRSRGGRMQLMYVLKKQVPLTPRFKFYKLGRQRARTAFPLEFKRALARALATAR